MKLKKWEDLPLFMQNESVKRYYDILQKKKISLLVKRLFDIIVALIALVLLSPLFIILSIIIKADSKGPVLFKQIRVSQYGKHFKILKFRTMVNNAEKIGNQVTSSNDNRVTKAGRALRKYRLDEIPQLINIITGDMSFVGTRPEVIKYIGKYTDEMVATLLLPAGVTSNASIEYKDEGNILNAADDIDAIYLNTVLPIKMEYNLDDIVNFNLLNEFKVILNTAFAVLINNSNTIQTRSINSGN